MKNLQIKVTGLVQGVGYRPFVARLASELSLNGKVKNAGGIVFIEASGNDEAVNEFVHRLHLLSPSKARVDSIEVTENDEPCKDKSFFIEKSITHTEKIRMIPADLPTCKDCERELLDPANRRYRYPFISCVNCGPRYSIIESVPYDRETISMREFPMCDSCSDEYTALSDRRCHAQTIACHDCGPVLMWSEIPPDEYTNLDKGDSSKIIEDSQIETPQLTGEIALQRAVGALKEGKVIAIKDIGGFHFAFRPDLSEPAKRLRSFKNRENKPFAVMFGSLQDTEKYCLISDTERKLLCSDERPIVLLRVVKDFAYEIGMGSDRMGVMLPCNPLQILLIKECGPLVMTSGNRGGEPIITDENVMLELMKKEHFPDGVLYHGRRIVTPLDDSIYQASGRNSGRVQIIRRARGLVPDKIDIGRELSCDIFAAGGDLKSVFALGKGHFAYLSQHFGDLEDLRAQNAYTEAVSHMSGLFDFHPVKRAIDMHPGYYCRKLSSEIGETHEFQHHHTHVASVIAEHHIEGKVLGISFDGTGCGEDGTVWGSEFLLCEGDTYKRVAHLQKVSLIGSSEGMRNAETILFGYMANLEDAKANDLLKNMEPSDEQLGKYQMIKAAIDGKINTCETTSMGRLFDAVACALGIKNYNTYEGECAAALEITAGRATKACEISLNNLVDTNLELDAAGLLCDILKCREKGIPIEEIALGFHMTLATWIHRVCAEIRIRYGVTNIALCGGCFLNRILLNETIGMLEADGFRVYINEKVPPGDGGICLGQMYLASFNQSN